MNLFPHIGIDFGTYKTRIVSKYSVEIYEEPTVVAAKDGKLLGFGQAALASKNNLSVEIIHPLQNGEIANSQIGEAFIYGFYKSLSISSKIFRAKVFVSCSTSESEVNKQAIHELVKTSIGSDVFLLDTLTSILALQDKEKLSPQNPCFVLHIGAGNTALGIFTNQGVAFSMYIPFGGDYFDKLIQRQVYAVTQKRISLFDCQNIKHEIGTLDKTQNERMWQGDVQCLSGETEGIKINSTEIKMAMEKGLNTIADDVEWFITGLPDDFADKLKQKSFLLSGGCGYIPGIEKWLTNRLGVGITVVPEPDKVVIRGIQKLLSEQIRAQ